ncbi:nicotinate-nucleotide adenylyltransferase [Botrimarina hoheduenensis]|uniref:Probable nicotinate-nucleotide adenylyltransferase n=1 Tax=Botrimarina hoheduenensis TaxID=2528000 RepID=A0A5C5VY44_9BACT|nr:nicotinate-nucleotide adenylyltransferase [Botrimarina hoheduenensis]TWT43380.1 Nicotinate-nucleotide adenylyltransferase [Botrimarina hoheduenensis]
MRLGLFGGSFDPLHNGHLALAAACRDQAQLDEVWFVPAAQQPHKPEGPIASAADRVAMLRLATANELALRVSTIEIDRGGVSYTVDTLSEIAAAHTSAELFFLMGADTLHDLPLWREPAEVLRLATPLVVHRAGEGAVDFSVLAELVSNDRLEQLRALLVEMPPVAISSRELRARLAASDTPHDELPPSVLRYIARHRLYR